MTRVHLSVLSCLLSCDPHDLFTRKQSVCTVFCSAAVQSGENKRIASRFVFQPVIHPYCTAAVVNLWSVISTRASPQLSLTSQHQSVKNRNNWENYTNNLWFVLQRLLPIKYVVYLFFLCCVLIREFSWKGVQICVGILLPRVNLLHYTWFWEHCVKWRGNK